MYLRMITVVASHQAAVPDGLVFHWSAHHVKEIFAALLPRNFSLDGSSKVQVTCGPRGGEPQYWQALGTSNYYVEHFNFHEYERASPELRENMILGVIEQSLADIASRSGKDSNPVSATAQAVREHQFRLSIEIKRLAVTLPDRSARISVFRDLCRRKGECWTLRISDRRRNVLGEAPMGKCPHYLDMREAYRTAALEGSMFTVRDRFGKVIAASELSGLLPTD